MKIVEDNMNPCRRRYVERYNSLPEDVQKQWDDVKNLPKEKLYLKPIKRKRAPDTPAGTIFAMKLPEDVYMFGKIVNDNLNLPMIKDGHFVIFVFAYSSRDMMDYPTELTEKNILAGPWIINDGLWRNGTFFTVGYQEVSEQEKAIDYGFYRFRYVPAEAGGLVDRGDILDAAGNKLDREPKYLSICGYRTLDGIEQGIRKEIIANPELIKHT